jgi:hypothetical protein
MFNRTPGQLLAGLGQGTRFVVAGALPLVVFSARDLGLAAGSQGIGSWLAALGSASAAGAGLGILASLFLGFVSRLRSRARIGVWSVVGAGVGFWFCDILAVRANLGGPYDHLARLGIVASVIAGLGAGGLGWSLQPRKEDARSPWDRMPAKARLAVALLAVACAGVLTYLDRQGYVIEYPAAALVLRAGSLLLSAFAALELGRFLTSRFGSTDSTALLRLGLTTAGLVLGSLLLAVVLARGARAERLRGLAYPGFALNVLDRFSDFDLDGRSAWFGGRDCEAFDSNVSPDASEIPGNGIDDNCRGGDRAASPSSPPPPAAAALPPAPMSVVYITVDTVGTEHLGVYGYPKHTTPALDAWAEQALIFEQAYTSGSSTTLVLGSNFRGVYPRRLQWTRVAKTLSGAWLPFENGVAPKLPRGHKLQRTYRLPAHDPHPTLPELLSARGMRTFGVSAVHFAARGSTLVGSFDEQVALTEEGSKEPDDRGSTEQALKWLAGLAPTDRFFMWVHYLGPHSPSTKDPKVPSFGSGLVGEYDHEVATFDDRVAPLLAALTARQAQGEPITVIVSADHGEEFSQHRYHGHSTGDRVAHIPLLVRAPQVKAGRTQALASSVDILPTVLALTATPDPGGGDGRSLVPVLDRQIDTWPRIVLTDGWVNDNADELPSNQLVATDGRQRLGINLVTLSAELLDLERERNGRRAQNLIGQLDDQPLRSAIDDYLEQVPLDPRAR